MTWNNVQPPCNTCVHCAQSSQDHRNHQCSTMPHAAYLHSQVAVLRQPLSMFLANVISCPAIMPTDISCPAINKKTSVCLSISETDVWTIGLIFLAVGIVVLLCVVMPLHDGQVGSLPPSGRPPTRQVSPAGYMFSCSPYGDQ